eukprot:TRINITY_DN218_c1_g3_i1.p3 TRINITY_DN218_c1_g3~~TRINITY_DN218_c1_g3_i1.p3  ORF type:complete len:100 (-),score=14.91 TRINITY_DN218_c1_g3_i1:61-360(-)
MFLLFLTVTRTMPGTGFIPSFCTALRLFFSARFCLPAPSFAPSAPSRLGMSSSVSSSLPDSSSSFFSTSSTFFSAALDLPIASGCFFFFCLDAHEVREE